ncbi:hypothetical protein RRG08_049754 [Elysia crispata]|uniref:Uncharacterized protein n=1 Tax=Elysia crispata TaxID=231223 RepID=A0AAE0ZDF8_9GAST|nr:hypothetical protein RRG08_049754 [Elysia crispata]
MSTSSDIDLTVWVQNSEFPLNSDSSSGDSPKGGFGDLTIIANSNGENDVDDVDEDGTQDTALLGDTDPILESIIGDYTTAASSGVDVGSGGTSGGDANTGASLDLDNELLHRLAGRHDDFLSTVVNVNTAPRLVCGDPRMRCCFGGSLWFSLQTVQELEMQDQKSAVWGHCFIFCTQRLQRCKFEESGAAGLSGHLTLM